MPSFLEKKGKGHAAEKNKTVSVVLQPRAGEVNNIITNEMVIENQERLADVQVVKKESLLTLSFSKP